MMYLNPSLIPTVIFIVSYIICIIITLLIIPNRNFQLISLEEIDRMIKNINMGERISFYYKGVKMNGRNFTKIIIHLNSKHKPTHDMKKLFTLLALTISFSINAQISENSTNNSGVHSSAIGSETTASGQSATAMGQHSSASGMWSTAMGYDTTASGNGSTATGATSIASGDYSIAMGYQVTASSVKSTAMGGSTTASGQASTAMGSNTIAQGNKSTAMGEGTYSTGRTSTAMGYYTTASGKYSTAMGSATTASDYASVVIGQFNSSGHTATSLDLFSTSAPAFVIGNGTAINSLSDAFKVMFNGDTTVSNDLTVSGDVVISSDARLKSNIVSLGSTLAKLLQIDGKSYEMKGKQKIGVLAQEIQEVFPELVSEGDNEMLAVNYQGLVPVLINALKEQQNEIEILKQQQSEINKLKYILNQLILKK